MDSFAPLFFGQDPTGQILAVIEWDSDNSCFILKVEGSGAAPSACQVIMWSGYGGLTGAYTRLCGADGGCDANAGISTVNAS